MQGLSDAKTHPFSRVMYWLLGESSFTAFIPVCRVSKFEERERKQDFHTKFAGLMTYANLPYMHCLAAEGQDARGLMEEMRFRAGCVG